MLDLGSERMLANGDRVLDIPSRRLIQALQQENINTKPALELALYHVHPCKGGTSRAPCVGCEDSWYAQYCALCETDEEHLSLVYTFDLLIDYSSGWHTLTPITDPVWTQRRLTMLKQAGCKLDLTRVRQSSQNVSLDPAKLKQFGLVHCNCATYLHYTWCLHVCLHARVVSGIMKSVPPKWESRRYGHAMQGKPARALAGGALGYR